MVDVVRLLLGGGGVLALVGTYLGSTDGLVAGLVATARSAAGTDWVLAAALGGVGLLAAAVSAIGGRGSALDQASMPEAERPISVPTAGSSFDGRLTGWRARLPVVGRDARRTIRDRLREAAIAALATERDWSRERARRHVDRGDWTDDDLVAGYLGDGADAPLGERLVAIARGEPWLERSARRTVDEIESLSNHRVGDDEPTSPDGGETA